MKNEFTGIFFYINYIIKNIFFQDLTIAGPYVMIIFKPSGGKEKCLYAYGSSIRAAAPDRYEVADPAGAGQAINPKT